MEIVWTYGAIDQHATGFGPVWTWAGDAGAAAPTGPVSRSTVAGTDRSEVTIAGTDRSECTVAGTLRN